MFINIIIKSTVFLSFRHNTGISFMLYSHGLWNLSDGYNLVKYPSPPTLKSDLLQPRYETPLLAPLKWHSETDWEKTRVQFGSTHEYVDFMVSPRPHTRVSGRRLKQVNAGAYEYHVHGTGQAVTWLLLKFMAVMKLQYKVIIGRHMVQLCLLKATCDQSGFLCLYWVLSCCSFNEIKLRKMLKNWPRVWSIKQPRVDLVMRKLFVQPSLCKKYDKKVYKLAVYSRKC